MESFHDMDVIVSVLDCCVNFFTRRDLLGIGLDSNTVGIVMETWSLKVLGTCR